MNILFQEHQDFIKKLIDHNVKFILVGGFAVIYYGYTRTTGDLDLWLKPDNENRDKLIKVLRDVEINDDDLAHMQQLDFSSKLVFHIGTEPVKIDFLTSLPGVSFEDADKMKGHFPMDHYLVPIIHLNHLIASKMTSGRTKDKLDVEELQNIQKRKPGRQ